MALRPEYESDPIERMAQERAPLEREPLMIDSDVSAPPEMGGGALMGRHQVGDAIITGSPELLEVDLNPESFDLNDRRQTDEGAFNENLAEYLYGSERRVLAQKLIEYSEIDKQSRKDWEQRLKSALVMIGVVKEKDTALPWKGASSMVHPGIAKACVQYQSRAIEEFFPPTGPVKVTTIGDAHEDVQQQARRVEDFMNWYYTSGDKGYFPDTDTLHLKLPLFGSVFRKSYLDPMSADPRQRHVGAEDFIAPYTGTDLESMPRYAHRYVMMANDIKRSIAAGYFIDVELQKGTSARFTSVNLDSTEDKGDDRTPALHQDDDVYEILEYHLDIEIPGIPDTDLAEFDLPYIVFVEKVTGEVLRVERNWRENDPRFLKRVWFTHYRYLPGLGFYGFGLLHLIGSLGEAATGAVRALLDTAARSNMQGGFKSKDAKGGDIMLENGVWKDVDMTAEEMAKGFYTPPTPAPNPALFQLLELLTQGIDSFTSATEAVVGDAPTNAPVGTTLALIEQGSKVFSAIHKRTHASALHEFQLFTELVQFSHYDEYPFTYDGQEQIVLKTDFDARIDVIPVSDPNIWSSTQRIALAQAVLQAMVGDPELFGEEQRIEAYRRLFVALKVPDIEKLLPKPQAGPPPVYDPVTENMRMMTAKPVVTKPWQDHTSHIAVHENWLQNQLASSPEEVLELLLPVALSHIQEHKAYLYQQQVMQQLGEELPIFDLGAGEEEQEEMPPDLERMLSAAAASALLPINDPQGDAEAQAEQEALMSEQERLDHAAQRDQDRKDKALEAEQQRLDLKEALNARREQAAFDRKQELEGRAFKHKLSQQDDLTDAQIGMKDRSARTADSAFQRSSELKAKAAAKKPAPKAKSKGKK